MFGIVILFAARSGAQTRESITVEVVDVPVYVFSHGKPVRNLTKDDFELFVNGKRQTIDYFDPIEFAPAAAAPSTQAEKTVVTRRMVRCPAPSGQPGDVKPSQLQEEGP